MVQNNIPTTTVCCRHCHHKLSAKYSVFNNLTQRASTVYTNSQLLQKEEHIRRALLKCNMLFGPHIDSKLTLPEIQHHLSQKQQQQQQPKQQPFVDTLYQGFKWKLQNICGKMGVQVHFTEGNTIRNLLVSPKYRGNITQKNASELQAHAWWTELWSRIHRGIYKVL